MQGGLSRETYFAMMLRAAPTPRDTGAGWTAASSWLRSVEDTIQGQVRIPHNCCPTRLSPTRGLAPPSEVVVPSKVAR